jgi:hypothetical protein
MSTDRIEAIAKTLGLALSPDALAAAHAVAEQAPPLGSDRADRISAVLATTRIKKAS